MKLAVIGAAGLLGQKLVETGVRAGHQVIPLDLVEGLQTAGGVVQPLDLTDVESVRNVMESSQPDWIMNAAAYTMVDASEDQKSLAHAVNVTGVRNLLESADRTGARLCALSTDYVFDGRAGPYAETAPRNPLGAYGATKAEMEELVAESPGSHLVARSMVLYGAASRVRTNFALWVVESLMEGKRIRVVIDQMGNPTLAADLARLLIEMVEQRATGLYHVAGADWVSRYEFAGALAERFGLDAGAIDPVTTAELGQQADRPLRSGFVLDRLRTELGLEPLGLEESLLLFREEYERYGGKR
jgi:dTDP-4-dehydrorhamnose reductase